MSQLADLSPHLQRLLFQQGEVALANIGRWRVIEQPASLQRVAGTVFPKRGELTFEPGEAQSSAELVSRLEEAWQSNTSSVADRLEQQVETLQRALEKKQKVLLPGMGWLSQREEGLHFESSTNNFLLESFGLGPVDAYPVIPKKEEKAAAAATSAAPPARRLWWLGLVALLLLLPVIWFIWKTPTDLDRSTEDSPVEPAPAYQSGGLETPTESAYIEPNKRKREQQSPTPAPRESTTTEEENNANNAAAGADEPGEENTAPSSEAPLPENPPSETATSSLSPETAAMTNISREEANYFIILGSFVDTRNATVYSEEVKQAGYPTILQQAGSSVRVGIPVKGEAEPAEALLQKIKTELNSEAWLQKRQ